MVIGTSVGLFYTVLLRLRFARRDAVAIATLALLFPWATGVRFWATGAVNNIAVMLFFAGFILATDGLRRGGRRGAGLHLAAATLYAASVLTYEACVLLIPVASLAYVWLYGRSAGWRWRAALDLAIFSVLVTYGVLTTTRSIAAGESALSSANGLVTRHPALLRAEVRP